MKTVKKLNLSWVEKTVEDTERVGSMYCYQRCDINVN